MQTNDTTARIRETNLERLFRAASQTENLAQSVPMAEWDELHERLIANLLAVRKTLSLMESAVRPSTVSVRDRAGMAMGVSPAWGPPLPQNVASAEGDL
jgi:hypothetical protein